VKTWLRLTLVTMAVGGGFTGVAVAFQALLGPQGRRPINFVLIGAFLLLFAFVTASGLLFVHNPKRTGPLLLCTAIQIPWVSSPIIAYKFAAGFQVCVALIGGKFSGGFRLGSDFQINLFQRLPWGIGINLFALLMFVLLLRAEQARDQPPAPEVAIPPESNAPLPGITEAAVPASEQPPHS
jgi:hypothetical protein